MKAAELAGLDAAQVTQTAVRSRSLDGTRDVASVLDARLRAMAEPLVPLPLRALGPVPEEPGERLDWQQRASTIGAYRELYGAGDQADPIGPEPPGNSPGQRAAWHAAFAALTRTDTRPRSP
jgi:hypothetical protein